MPKKRDDSNPLDAKRRLLEQQEQLLAQKRAELKAQLESGGAPQAAAAAKADEPPIWRIEDEPNDYEAEPARFRHLARQRRRDMIVFFACIGVLLLVIAVLLWVLCIHTAAAPPGSA
ncbi:MAG TPA: hypothetical protein VHY09_14490 [Candidatus Methylacidiphilales bacterium]|jgi:hypothetical protein|nr:hypothetical protein [Candidatus Methylacidiphilales bacterium]